ncbi:MAG TPA: hypothetical protein VN616_03675 [Puia sp.]|nr:hypothetical protein [Puia sp.]
MESREIKALLERYWQAETSLEEEALLASYFRLPEIDADLEPVRELFAWKEEEGRVRPGADFDRRLLERIGRPVLRRGWFQAAAAAAVILGVGVSLLIAVMAPGGGLRDGKAGGVALAPQSTPVVTNDTYNDPRLALAAVQHALLLASVRMNEGEHITQKSINRLHKSWEVAARD